MNKLSLLTGLSALSLAAFAEVSAPTMIEDALIEAISPNGMYAVSQGTGGFLRIFNLTTGEEYEGINGDVFEEYYVGQGNCVSNNGIVIASSRDSEPLYWKDGVWYDLPAPAYALSSYAQAISADGSRMCGIVRVSGMGSDEDVLMVVPCIWNADGDGFAMPVMLPHPDLDYAGRVPQYITAVDMSSDGKVIVGQIRDAQGLLNYPILYKENENGEWSYEIPHEELINPDNLEIVPFPGEGPAMPQCETFMTTEEIEAYIEAYNKYVESQYTDPCPEYWQFMSQDEIAAYNEAVDVYNEEAKAYNKKFDAWVNFVLGVADASPAYAYNSVRISPDGKTIGCTVQIVGERDPITGFPTVENDVWMFDLTSGKISKYAKDGDLNMYYIGNDGIGIATTSAGTVSNSFILKGGEVLDIVTWMNSKVPEYASWIDENMVFPYEKAIYNEELEDYEFVYDEAVMTGRATSTPDFSVISLSVQNIWDFEDEGIAYIFNLKEHVGVDMVDSASEEKTIYDLSGRRLRNASAPGIYIINGEKKVVR